MKRIAILILATLITTGAIAQNDKAKGKGKDKTKNEKSVGKDDPNKKHEDVVWEGTSDTNGKGPKPSKNQPAKVRASFQRDYPNAVNVTWSKYRGDWTASFGNGLLRSTAVYHANGDRRDTRTPIPQSQLPNIIFKDIFKGTPTTQLGDIIKIEVPQAIKDIFRVKTTTDGVSRFLFYNSDGVVVSYDY
jgi:hypothetical protein